MKTGREPALGHEHYNPKRARREARRLRVVASIESRHEGTAERVRGLMLGRGPVAPLEGVARVRGLEALTSSPQSSWLTGARTRLERAPLWLRCALASAAGILTGLGLVCLI